MISPAKVRLVPELPILLGEPEIRPRISFRQLFTIPEMSLSMLTDVTYQVYAQHLGIIELILLSTWDFQAYMTQSSRFIHTPEDQDLIDHGKLVLDPEICYFYCITGLVPLLRLDALERGQVLVYWREKDHITERQES